MRKAVLLTLILVAAVSWFHPRRSEGVGQSYIFPISIKGTVYTTNIAFGPGFKAPKVKTNDKSIGNILRGIDTQDESIPYLDLLHADGSGRFYLYFDGRGLDGSTTWRIGTNPSGTMTTTATGTLTQDGFFWVAGTYQLPVLGTLANGNAVGKVTFAKGTFAPTKISGSFTFFSAQLGHGITAKFKTVGPPTRG